MSAKYRALVIDDSAFARKVVREVLEESGKFEVVGIARDGLEALEAIAELAPDVITLDLMMPQLDGVGVLDALGDRGPPALVVSISGSNTQLGAAALLKGALDIVEKPSALATERLYEMRDELIAKALAAATSTKRPRPADAQVSLQNVEKSRFGMIVVGASTGGPRAVSTVIRGLPARLPVPVVAAIHIPEGYTKPLADRLAPESRMPVLEAVDGAILEAGTVVIAPGGRQSSIVGSPGKLRLSITDQSGSHPPFSPSIDLLFESAARAASPILGAVLTGMGNDGMQGARAIRAAGGAVVTESASTCIVYGMPRAVLEAGQSDGSISLDKIAEWLANRLLE